MYRRDSFFTLSVLGQIGLAALSACLLLLAAAVLWRLGRNRPIILRLALAVAIFVLFVWASPQIYYQYYRLIIDGLPNQWVIGPPPSLGHLGALVTFQAEGNLSNHAQGALGWALMVLAILRRRPSLA